MREARDGAAPAGGLTVHWFHGKRDVTCASCGWPIYEPRGPNPICPPCTTGRVRESPRPPANGRVLP